ncbi:Ecdysteroid UDP-glucosyltransferase [Gryllus bimaculatus]|nr:Ecdysteroid UDP-glucosyltransferase [Gryllus bimaculatus]
MDYPQDFKFDAVLMEPIGVECLLGLLPRFGDPPIIAVNSFSVPMWVLDITGTPANPAYVPHFYLPFDDNMNFQERVLNFLAYTYTKVYYDYFYIPFMEREAKAFFGPQIPSVYDTMHNVSVALSNYHPTLDTAFPAAPNLIPIGAIQVKDPKPLPADLKKFLDEAKEGAIYMSFGTNVRSDQLSLEKRKMILSAFADLPQKVLWKFESDIPDVPKNVLIRKWLPQSDILGKEN